jgi:FixJ family two-component response regulator
VPAVSAAIELAELSLIAIVDDDDSVRTATESIVRSLGQETRTFPSAESFLQSSLVLETSCLILDVQMPNMNGIQLQEHLLRLGVNIPIIFITAYPDESDKSRALKAGAVCYLRKPFDLEQRLVDCLNKVLDDRRDGPASAV